MTEQYAVALAEVDQHVAAASDLIDRFAGPLNRMGTDDLAEKIVLVASALTREYIDPQRLSWFLAVAVVRLVSEDPK